MGGEQHKRGRRETPEGRDTYANEDVHFRRFANEINVTFSLLRGPRRRYVESPSRGGVRRGSRRRNVRSNYSPRQKWKIRGEMKIYAPVIASPFYARERCRPRGEPRYRPFDERLFGSLPLPSLRRFRNNPASASSWRRDVRCDVRTYNLH